MRERLMMWFLAIGALLVLTAGCVCRFFYNLWTRGRHERNQQEWDGEDEKSD